MSLNGLNQVTCRMRDAGARTIDRLDTRLIESLVVLRGNDSTTHNEDVTSAKRLQLINHLKNNGAQAETLNIIAIVWLA